MPKSICATGRCRLSAAKTLVSAEQLERDVVALGVALGGMGQQPREAEAVVAGHRPDPRLKLFVSRPRWGAALDLVPSGSTTLRMTLSPPAPAPVSAGGRPNPCVSIVFTTLSPAAQSGTSTGNCLPQCGQLVCTLLPALRASRKNC